MIFARQFAAKICGNGLPPEGLHNFPRFQPIPRVCTADENRLRFDAESLKMYYEIIKEELSQVLKRSPMHPEVVNDFNMLFNIVCTHHEGPVLVDFGRQMQWEGVIAGQCTQHVQFLQGHGINAFLDCRTHKLVFSEGTAEELHALLLDTLHKEEEFFATRNIDIPVSNRARQRM
jgi:hypothetical protein